MDENRAIFTEEFKSAVITVLTAFRSDLQGSSALPEAYKNYALQRIEKTIRNFERGAITAREALETGINPLKMPLEL